MAMQTFTLSEERRAKWLRECGYAQNGLGVWQQWTLPPTVFSRRSPRVSVIGALTWDVVLRLWRSPISIASEKPIKVKFVGWLARPREMTGADLGLGEAQAGETLQ